MERAKSLKSYQLVLFIVGCILVNYGGKELAVRFSLPFWMDAVGTTLAAYVLGPVCGAIVGVTGNVIYGFSAPDSYIYALTSLSIGVCVGCFAKRAFFESFFETLSISALMALIATVLSVVLNMLLYDGMTGNLWGDGVIAYLKERSFPAVICYFVGEFYIDFLDKVLTFLFVYFLLYIRRKGKASAQARKKSRQAADTLLAVALLAAVFRPTAAYADSVDEQVDNNTSYVQTIYNGSNGLPCGEANDIVQTNDGILWIGTYSGLYRYNGTEIRLEDKYESVKNVNCLYVDDEGRLWIGTNDNGFSISVNETITHVVEETDGLSANSVRCIVRCADGSYYIGTTACMQVVSLNGGLQFVGDIQDVNYAMCATADASGHVATIDTNGILYLLQDRQVLASLELNEEQEIFSTCEFDEEGLLYVGTSSNHIYTYDISSGDFVPKDTYTCGELQGLNSIYFAETGEAYLCAENGVGYMDGQGQYWPISTGQFNNSIDNMTVDYQGNLWFASSRQGLLRLCRSGVFDYYEALGLEQKLVNTSGFWNDMLYVGTDSGLDVLDLKNGAAVSNELTELLDGVRIRCLRADSQNRLWICTYGSGLWEVDGDTITTYDTKNGLFGDWARAVIEMSDGTIVAAGNNGIIFLVDDQIEYTFQYGTGLSNAMILSLMEMPDGSLMAGTDGDGIVIIRDGAVQETITRADGLSSDVILRTVPDTGGDGTFVVTSNGLCYIAADRTVTTLDNFPYFNNYDIWISSQGKLFVLSSAGIYVVDREELLSGEEVNYTLLDAQTGLSAALTVNSWNTSRDEDYLYLSCDTGVYGINMLDAMNQAGSYRIKIASIKLDQVSYEPDAGSAFTIGRDVNKIEIVPEVINYTTEEPYVYYYLEGYEDTYNVAPLSELGSLVYTGLPAGSYTLHLGVLDSDRKTVLEDVTFSLVKEREIYDTPWFGAYMLVVMALFVSWLTWFLVRTQIQRTLNFQKKELAFAKSQVEMGNQTILAIAKTVDAKDERTSLHSQRVAEYSVLIAKALGKSDEECEILKKTALLHDIGKIGIPDSVLKKPAKLTDEEYEIMKSHVVKGMEILKGFTLVDHVWEGALYHHERYDGKGYAAGLKGEEIPLNARIIGLADAFDAMTANRVYRQRLDFDTVLDELKKGRGTQFDPQLVDIMLEVIASHKIDIAALYAE
jgi:energy-coupling factor transport system substrate-specific component